MRRILRQIFEREGIEPPLPFMTLGAPPAAPPASPKPGA
jgi:hypothetical protein